MRVSVFQGSGLGALDGEDAAQNHLLFWRRLPPGSYCVTVEIYGSTGLRDSTHFGMCETESIQ